MLHTLACVQLSGMDIEGRKVKVEFKRRPSSASLAPIPAGLIGLGGTGMGLADGVSASASASVSSTTSHAASANTVPASINFGVGIAHSYVQPPNVSSAPTYPKALSGTLQIAYGEVFGEFTSPSSFVVYIFSRLFLSIFDCHVASIKW
jgi:hypothetical protein